MNELLLALIRRLVRVFYRRIETTGLVHVPANGPVLFIANHANGLVDPMLVLAVLDRPVVFVAKSTLWRIPILSAALDALGVVPVVRRVDSAREGEPGGGDRNEESFRSLAEALRGGKAVLIFPEGRSHSDPTLSPVKTGAARILLLAGIDVPVIPVGLWFVRKDEFRSDVLLRFGAPLAPPSEPTVEAWTRAMSDGLRDVTMNADSWADHEAARAVEAIYGPSLNARAVPEGAAVSRDDAAALERSFRNRRLLLDARRALVSVEPGAVERLARRARAFERLLQRIDVSSEALAEAPRARLAGRLAGSLALAALRFPLAAVGVAAFWVPYRLTGVVTERMLRGRDLRDQVALWKILVGIALHGATLALELFAIARLAGPLAALAAAFVLPACGLFALGAVEETERDVSRLHARLLRAGAAADAELLAREREALVSECDRLASVYSRVSGAGGQALADNPPG